MFIHTHTRGYIERADTHMHTYIRMLIHIMCTGSSLSLSLSLYIYIRLNVYMDTNIVKVEWDVEEGPEGTIKSSKDWYATGYCE
jgi:hypothetical protein